MRRRWFIVLLSIGAAIVALFAIAASRRGREPIYQGHPLSWWMDYTQAPTAFGGRGVPFDMQIRARRAVLDIGTNGLPFYLKWIEYRPSSWTLRGRTIIR